MGYGWNVPELANHGHEATKRRAIVREYVALMRALWHDTEAEFRGEHANLSPSWAWPKPVQRPSVPVLLGCSPTPRGYAEVVRLRLNFDRCLALGVDQVVLDLQAAEAGDLLPLLDRYAAVLKTSGA